MNERIEQLERQATETVKCGLNGTSTAESFNRKKFAELIAKECMNIVMQNRKYAIQHHWPATELANVCLYEIDKTFGVENGKETVSS